jgi:hypothetical protein
MSHDFTGKGLLLFAIGDSVDPMVPISIALRFLRNLNYSAYS